MVSFVFLFECGLDLRKVFGSKVRGIGRDGIITIRPRSKIQEFASLRAERAKFISRKFSFLAALRAFHLGHKVLLLKILASNNANIRCSKIVLETGRIVVKLAV